MAHEYAAEQEERATVLRDQEIRKYGLKGSTGSARSSVSMYVGALACGLSYQAQENSYRICLAVVQNSSGKGSAEIFSR